MSTEGIIMSCLIDAMEGPALATDDISGALIKTEYYKGVIISK